MVGTGPHGKVAKRDGDSCSSTGPPPGDLFEAVAVAGMRDGRVSHHICDSCICFEISRKRLGRPSRVLFLTL